MDYILLEINFFWYKMNLSNFGQAHLSHLDLPPLGKEHHDCGPLDVANSGVSAGLQQMVHCHRVVAHRCMEE